MNGFVNKIFENKKKIEYLSYHQHNTYEMILIQKGSISATINSKEYFIEAPALIIINAYENHKFSNSSKHYYRYILEINATNINLKLPSELIDILKNHPSNFNHCFNLSDKQFTTINNFFKSINNEYKSNNKYSYLSIEADVTKLILYIYNQFPNNVFSLSTSISKIQNYIDRNYSKINLLKDIYDKFFISESTLSHKFKDEIGFTPYKYLMMVRLMNAKNLLLSTSESISSIATKCGFNDLSNFIRQFRLSNNITPLQFRKKFIKRS